MGRHLWVVPTKIGAFTGSLPVGPDRRYNEVQTKDYRVTTSLSSPYFVRLWLKHRSPFTNLCTPFYENQNTVPRKFIQCSCPTILDQIKVLTLSPLFSSTRGTIFAPRSIDMTDVVSVWDQRLLPKGVDKGLIQMCFTNIFTTVGHLKLLKQNYI